MKDGLFLNLNPMGILKIVAIVLLIGWLIGFIGFGEAVGKFIHIALVLAIVSFIISLLLGRNV